jgi:hypothetical protein
MILCYYPKNSDIIPPYISFSYLDNFEISNDIALLFIQHFTKSIRFFLCISSTNPLMAQVILGQKKVSFFL